MLRDSDAIDRLRHFILSNPCRLIEVRKLSTLCGTGVWRSGIQHLIDYEGYDIVIVQQLAGTGPNCIFLRSTQQSLWFSEKILAKVVAEIEKRTDLCCKSCGRSQSEADPTTEGRRLRLFVNQLMDSQQWSGAACDNIEVVCMACKEGIEGLVIDFPSARKLKMQVRRGKGVDQLEVLHWLIKKYPSQTASYLRRYRTKKEEGNRNLRKN